MCVSSSRIAIVEDDPVMCKFLHLAVGQSDRLQVVGCADSVATGRALLRQHSCDLLLVDLELPDGSGDALIRHARACVPPIECMVVTSYGDNRHLFSALAAGAVGYLLKDELPESIGDTILQLLAGGSPMSPAIARTLVSTFCQRGGGEQVETQLTEREREVLQLLSTGLVRKEVARQLAISLHTVNSHVRAIYRKLEVGSNIEAINRAQQKGVIPAG
ncbi:MAG: response regulator transcription factor [Mariprofundales bacterium]|nr:response regulator transcription factor [Mariprofundales bacterium]